MIQQTAVTSCVSQPGDVSLLDQATRTLQADANAAQVFLRSRREGVSIPKCMLRHHRFRVSQQHAHPAHQYVG
jgi:hypothetical protein